MGKASCKDCGQGTFQDVVKASCKDSGQGKFQNVADQVICVDCGADNCVDCGTDKYAATKRALSNSAQATRIIQLALRIKTCRSWVSPRGAEHVCGSFVPPRGLKESNFQMRCPQRPTADSDSPCPRPGRPGACVEF